MSYPYNFRNNSPICTHVGRGTSYMGSLLNAVIPCNNRGVDGRKIFLDTQDYARFVHDLYEFNDTAGA